MFGVKSKATECYRKYSEKGISISCTNLLVILLLTLYFPFIFF